MRAGNGTFGDRNEIDFCRELDRISTVVDCSFLTSELQNVTCEDGSGAYKSCLPCVPIACSRTALHHTQVHSHLPSMALCDACLGIDIRGLLLSYLQELKEKNLGPLWEGPIRIAPDVRDPYVTAQSFQIHHSILTCNERSETCELCALFWEGWLIYCSRQAGDRELEANKLEDSPVRLYLLEGLHGTKSRPRFKVCFGNAAPIWTDAGSSDGPIWFEARTIHGR